MKKKMNFETMDSLGVVSLVINEASEAVNDKTRNILNSPISDILLAVGGGAGGVAIDLAVISLIAGKYFGKLGMPAILHVLKIIGGGNAKHGLFVLSIPVVFLTLGANMIAKRINKKKLEEAKTRLLQQATEKLSAILAAQREEIDVTKVRADELERLNILLTDFIRKLKEDMDEDAFVVTAHA